MKRNNILKQIKFICIIFKLKKTLRIFYGTFPGEEKREAGCGGGLMSISSSDIPYLCIGYLGLLVGTILCVLSWYYYLLSPQGEKAKSARKNASSQLISCILIQFLYFTICGICVSLPSYLNSKERGVQEAMKAYIKKRAHIVHLCKRYGLFAHRLHAVFDNTVFGFTKRFYRTIGGLTIVNVLLVVCIGLMFLSGQLDYTSYGVMIGASLAYHIILSLFLIGCFVKKLFDVVKSHYLSMWRDKKRYHGRTVYSEQNSTVADDMNSVANIMKKKAETEEINSYKSDYSIPNHVALADKSSSDPPIGDVESDIIRKIEINKQCTIPLPSQDWMLIDVMTKCIILYGAYIFANAIGGIVLFAKQLLSLNVDILDLCGGLWICVLEILFIFLFSPGSKSFYSCLCHGCHQYCKQCVHDLSKARLRKIRENEEIAMVITQD
ncbi:hypothetical protein RFI_27592 [Reticulomyxa filosa]|uniref:Uncharacterized protein n=1 Tax=Reticulomyxa filosa TaxID=46433 RepID=X6M713_RETFI|nr:hypothetical protein RFI_27592 [Reticulomyxa filosa]|eukprot:ETO09788.1 hypothetical protein RFI_27592 [Reticulomyxa filosa]